MKLEYWLQSLTIISFVRHPWWQVITAVRNPRLKIYGKWWSKHCDDKDVRTRWRCSLSYNISTTLGTRPFGSIRPWLVLSCKLCDSKNWSTVECSEFARNPSGLIQHRLHKSFPVMSQSSCLKLVRKISSDNAILWTRVPNFVWSRNILALEKYLRKP